MQARLPLLPAGSELQLRILFNEKLVPKIALVAGRLLGNTGWGRGAVGGPLQPHFHCHPFP